MAQFTQSVIYNSAGTSTDIAISVTVGFAQPSVSRVYVDGKAFNDEIRDSFNLTVGSANVLRGKEVVCITTVSDMQPNTNETSLKIKVRGGSGVLDVQTLRLRANEGEVVFYKINIIII